MPCKMLNRRAFRLFQLVLVTSKCLANYQRQTVGSFSDDPLQFRDKRHVSDISPDGYNYRQYPRDCKEVYECNQDSGIATIKPDGAPGPFEVYCNNSVDGGKWTVFQRRMDGAVDFYRAWDEYKKGFGFLHREFWLGNDKIAYLTNQGDYELRIDFVNKLGNSFHAKYNLFRITDEWSKYRLVDLGEYSESSTAGFDALDYHRNRHFSTYDSEVGQNCPVKYHGAWWYGNCHHSNLNGDYFGCDDCYDSVRWKELPENEFNILYTEMKIRPLSN